MAAPGAARRWALPALHAVLVHRHARRVPPHPPGPGRPGADHARGARAALCGGAGPRTSSGSTARFAPVRLVPRGSPAGRPRHLDQPAAPGQRHRRPADLAERLPARLRHAHLAARRRAARRSSRRSTATGPPTTRSGSSPRSASRCPSFWFGLLLVELFSLQLDLLPVSGYGSGFLGHLESLTLPAITVGLYLAPLDHPYAPLEPDRDALGTTTSPRRAPRGFSETRVDRQARAAQRADRDGDRSSRSTSAT